MIIVEIKRRKQLKEAPLLDLIDVTDSRSKNIGKAGMTSDPEGFVKTAKYLYDTTKQNLVIVLPSTRLLADTVAYAGTRENFFKTPEVLKDFLKKKGINPDEVHVLMPISMQIEKDNTEPLWTMVHDAIGHDLENKRSLDPANYVYLDLPNASSGADLLLISNALYVGVSEKLQAAKSSFINPTNPEKIAKLKSHDIFDVNGPLKDDRWPDILAAVAFDGYDETKVSSYLEEQGREDLKDALMEKVQSLKEKVKPYAAWPAGWTTILRSW